MVAIGVIETIGASLTVTSGLGTAPMLRRIDRKAD